MTLEKYLEDRDIWQNNTIEEIRKKVIYKPKTIKQNKVGEKLVAIYGPPQIGKTTLILCLLGIAPKFQKKVYNDIRARVPRGNSSTSTAIIYQQIDSDLYGVKYGENDSSIELCTDKELQEKIREVRTEVEDDSASKDILHIYIPQKYFSKKVLDQSGINIVDLPGDGSRNTKEKSHVDAVLNKYMALATVNIIACKANEIQSLETLQLPINVDWKNLPHKYIVVITNSYGLGTIRKFFKIKRKSRKVNFYEFVTKSYKDDLRDIIGNLSKIEAFPIDIGDSFEKLLNSCGLDEDDQKNLISTRNAILDEIRESIHQRQGNSLKSTMLDLKAYTTEYANQQRDNLQDQLNELNSEKIALIEDIAKAKKRVSKYNVKIGELESYHAMFVKLRDCTVSIKDKSARETIEDTIMSYVQKGRIKDSKHALVGEIRGILVGLIRDEFRDYSLSIDNPTCDVLYEDINMNIDFEGVIGDKIYKGGLFNTDTKQSDFLVLMDALVEAFVAQLKSEITNQINSQLRAIKEIDDDYLRYKQEKTKLERVIAKKTEKLYSVETKINSVNEKSEAIEDNREADKRIFDDYLRIADKEFMKYKRKMVEMVDSDSLSADEKVFLLIYLCMIEKDFSSISEMG